MNSSKQTLVWDLPTRIFHWSFATCFFGAWITHEMEASGFWLHTIFGYSALALVLWRVGWGFIGTRHALFRNFISGPRATLAYLRADSSQPLAAQAGHNPAGGWSIIVMLALTGLQACSGLLNGGELLMEGPWFHTLPGWAKDIFHEFHELNFNLLLGLVGLHLAAILFYAVKRKRNLVPAMVTGYSEVGGNTQGIGSQKLLPAMLLLVLAALIVWAIVGLAPPPSTDPMDMF
ncbi:MAG: cytochrome b/b6 domain-containing protein [Gammaproteobacteria bacterium]|nr:cytochrome b/b6 domain-containing protein [Gammaproteobacteria bacterium]